MIGIKVLTIVKTAVANIMAKPTPCKNEIVNFVGTWSGECHAILPHFLCKNQAFVTDKQWLL